MHKCHHQLLSHDSLHPARSLPLSQYFGYTVDICFLEKFFGDLMGGGVWFLKDEEDEVYCVTHKRESER